MTDVWSASTAGSNTGPRPKMREKLSVLQLVCGLSVGAVCVTTLLGPLAPAGADPVADLQAQAAQLSQEMLHEQLQVGAFEQQRSVAIAAVAQADQALQATEAQINLTHQRIAHDMTVLDKAAVEAYVAGGTAAGTDPLFASGRSAGQRSVYEHVVASSLSSAVGQLRSDRHDLQAEQASQESIVAQAQQEESQAATLLADAQSTQQALQAQSAQVHGQLAVAVAQQQASQQAAAAAALAAARAKAQPAGAAGGGAPAAVAGAGLVLPPFLVCVIQAESGGNYGAVSPTGTYMGAFQFDQPTWNYAAQLAGRPTLVGVPPNQASPADQDTLAIALYTADGEAPWYDPCRTG